MTTSLEITHPPAHGDLREGLINAGLTLLARDGTAGLTLRKCAALAGVSHAAPAHHFQGLPGLLDAIAARGYSRFADAMEAQASAGPNEPRARLEAICLAYFDFARDNPALYDLMFRQIWSLAGSGEELRLAGARAYAVLAEASAPFVLPGTAPGVVETQVWSLIHGYATLTLVGKLGRNRPIASVEDLLSLLRRLPLNL
ncbi:TetR/AcrR family transcriptional regulator [Devosia sp. XJ19-1]|uniref:TetR/AcrR family transcriptional regulator n=1 Tax=Devosia ureilytica TaxID=2952754 RepID=A0A9Q4AQV4_9HYPH|nr:TetR/AcrR family transcriptional regulator [Devosia ureilytica]MCP8885296.1 TetR/AcrR family transcriptional regulator [Devosia ureilytica]MCP8888754.1 TetR/AcrR family transcriptional regulator [Devosia ureilytica]